ncbi:50S ribosomal protein L32 [Candidatus Cyrtobacter comes]|uniref:Large ribosomal subunit protein bL32 n=1 Tax=Candidatus Cyrtobacter comes TaxID=675776 RepID=A0ABU5L902_9RICK|nr:50S ribosomal protein L32 [Candidatus Cyrtobacter comes]MDZ5762598.1 50S ribosomal protein L32 [Candidatus Cyrtobacter comes]
MAVPKKRTSKSRRNMRRAHDAISPVNVVVDKETGEYRLPHHVSRKDGMYNGKFVLKASTESEETKKGDV